MAITNAQQARQLYQGGGGADFGAPDKAEERASKGYGNPGGGKAASKGFNQNAAPGGQDSNVYGPSGPYNPEQALAAAKAEKKRKKEESEQEKHDAQLWALREQLANVKPTSVLKPDAAPPLSSSSSAGASASSFRCTVPPPAPPPRLPRCVIAPGVPGLLGLGGC